MTTVNPFDQIRATREELHQKNQILMAQIQNTDANGHPRPAPTTAESRRPYMDVVTSGDTRKIGAMTDHLLDRIEQLEANQKDV